MAFVSMIQGLAMRNITTVMQSSSRAMVRSNMRNGLSNMAVGCRGFAKPTAMPKRHFGNRTTRSNFFSSASFQQQQTSQAVLRSKNTPLTLLQHLRTRLFHTSRARRSAQSPNPTPNLGAPPQNENLSLGQRMRKLSREYGWSALGVYFTLSALDFPFCYLLVRYLGTDRIGRWEHIVVSNIERLIPESVKIAWREWKASFKQAEREMTGQGVVADHVEMAGWGVEEAQERNKQEASLATQLALAYAIHKSFIFIRVPIAAAVTPKVVKILRGWGWDIGKRTTKEAKAIRRATNAQILKK